MVEEIRHHRQATTSFEVAVDGYSGPGDTTLARAYEEGGATPSRPQSL
jgi:hypothetical protein